MVKYKFPIVIILALLIAGCNPQPEAKQLLRQAGRLVDAHPDSAMHLIDSIFYPERSLNRGQYMEFLVTQVQAKHKTYRPVAEDTLIFKAKAYFEKKNKDPDQTARAYFYSGCVLRERQQHDVAMRHYKKTEQLASQTGNTDLMGLAEYNMGDLLAEQGYYRQALAHYAEAADIYAHSPEKFHEKRAYGFGAMGRMYLLLKQPDSAFICFQKGLDIAGNAQDKKLQSLLAQNLSVMYKETGEYEKSEIYLRQSYMLNRDSTKLPRYYLNFAGIYSGMNLPDSATYYADKMEESLSLTDDDTFKLTAYNFLSNRQRALGNYLEALHYKDERERLLTKMIYESRAKSVYEIQQKYDFEQQQNHYNQMLIARQRWIILFLTVILLGGVSFTAYTISGNRKFMEVRQRLDTLNQMKEKLETILSEKDKHLTEKDKQLEEVGLQLKILKQTRERLETHLSEKDKHLTDRSKELQEAILLQFDVAKKILLLKSRKHQTKDRKVSPDSPLVSDMNRILYKQTDIQDEWSAMLSVIERACPGLSARMLENFPSLNEKEFRVAMLAYADFKTDETGMILGLKPNTVQSIRTDLRKKIDAPAKESTSDFLRRILD